MISATQPGMINKDYFQVFLTHLPTDQTVNFEGWVTSFSDDFSSEWKGTPVYGRMDELYTFQQTARKISLAFDVIAADKFEAAKNMRKLNQLAQFLYPTYSGRQTKRSSPVMTAAPLLKMKWNGLISNSLDGSALVGFLQGFAYTPDINAGQFFIESRNTKKPYIAYQNHSVQLEYTVLHTHLAGWVDKTVNLEGGGQKYIFGGNEETDVGSTYPHAVSDPTLTPQPPQESAPNPAGDNPLPYDEIDRPAGAPPDPRLPAWAQNRYHWFRLGHAMENNVLESYRTTLLNRDKASLETPDEP